MNREAGPSSFELARNRRRGKILAVVGTLLFGVGVWGLWMDLEWIAQPFYAYAWWGYILVLDGFVALRRGHSLFTARRKHLIPVLIGSVTFWYFFELLNLRFKNWYYVGVYESPVIGYPFSLVCFSTVLIGMFETFEAVTALGLFRRWRGEPGRLPGWASYAVQAVGALMVTLSLVFPTYLAPLVWGSLSFLLDPWNYRRGARSILRDFEARDFGLVARLLLAGLICGGFWESMNFLAPQKWIYTVRGLEDFKLFEMPLLGFLGFPALALDGMAFYSLIAYWFLNNETWEHPADLRYGLRSHSAFSPRAFYRIIPIQLAFGILVLVGVRQVNMASIRLDLWDLPSMTPALATLLEAEGIRRPIRLVRETKDPERRRMLLSRSGLEPEEFQRLLEEAELYAFKGIGAAHGALLREVGVTRVSELADWSAEDLHSALVRIADQEGARLPRLDMVRVWVLAARDRGFVMRTARGE
ncbi:MAG: hypothetical protein GHCLOJNM_03211 [bacterium]|nr:hypothetical protein [bacterium]